MSGASSSLDNLRWWWAGAAVAAELASYLCFAAAQRVLLGAGGVEAGRARVLGLSLASTSMQNSLPAGVAFAAAYSFRQYRRLGADEVLAGWVLVAVTVLSFVVISAMAMVGLFMALGTGSALDLVPVIIGIGAVAAVVVLAWTRRTWLLDRAVWAVRLCQRVTHRPRGDVAQLVGDTRSRLGAVTPERTAWVLAITFAGGNWVLDLGCLTLSFLAVGADVPWRGLLLAYAAAQLATTLPITPGGLGVVEGSLTVALVAFGGAEATAVAAVLVYRLISFWAELPVGWASWGVLTRRNAVAVRSAPAAVGVGVAGATTRGTPA